MFVLLMIKIIRKKFGYVLTDSAVFFYYKFIYHNLSSQNILNDEMFYDNYIEEGFLNDFVPKAFEKIAKQYLIRKKYGRAYKTIYRRYRNILV